MDSTDQAKDAESKRGPSKRKAIEAWLARDSPNRITQEHWRALLSEHAPISESYLRKLLRESGVPLDPLVDGVRQDSLDSLEASLIGLLDAYETARESGDRAAASACRKAVLSGKDHARWAAERAKDSAKKLEKEEMAEWMLVWLENPPLFRDWVAVRRAAMAKAAAIEARSNPPE